MIHPSFSLFCSKLILRIYFMTTLDNNYNNHAFDTVIQSDFILNKFKKVVAQNSPIHTLKNTQA